MEELLAQLDSNCFGLVLFLSSFLPEQRTSELKKITTSSDGCGVPLCTRLQHSNCEVSSWACILPARMPVEGKLYLHV